MFRTLALFTFLVADLALAQTGLPQDSSTVLPRILVIIDSSKSMTESPNGMTLTPPGSPGGDFDCTSATNTACTSKLCSAKQILCETMTSVSSNNRLSTSAAVGLATYYQYVLYLMKQDSRGALCRYDILESPGKPRHTVMQGDFTGTGATRCQSTPPYSCTGDSASVDIFAPLASSGLTAFCRSSVGTAVPTATTYNIEKVAAVPASNVPMGSSCYLYNYSTSRDLIANPRSHFPLRLPAGINTSMPGCFDNIYYAGASNISPQIVYYRRNIGENCSPNLSGMDALPAYDATGYPSATSQPSVITTVRPDDSANWCADTARTFPTQCFVRPATGGYSGTSASPTYPIHMYLADPPTSGGQSNLFVFYDPGVYSANGVTVPHGSSMVGANRFDTASNYTTPLKGTEHLWIKGNTNGICTLGSPGNEHTFVTPNETYRLTSGNFFQMEFTQVVDKVHNYSPKKLPSSIDVTPAYYAARNSYNCTPDWPCDISFKGIINPNFSGVGTYTNAPDPACSATSCTAGSVSAANCRAGPVISFTGPMFATLASSSGSCAASFTSDLNSVTTPQTRINGSQVFPTGNPWPTDCGPGKDTCTFKAQSTTAVNATTSCPSVSRFNSTAALSASDAELACPAYKLAFGFPKTYTAANLTGYLVSLVIPASGTCTSSVSLPDATEAAKYSIDTGGTPAGLPGASYPMSLTNGVRADINYYNYLSDPTAVPTGWTPTGRTVSQKGITLGSPGRAKMNTAGTVDVANPSERSTEPMLNCGDFTGGTAPNVGDIGSWSGGSLGSWPGKKRFEGKVFTGDTTCGSEGSSPCYACRFTPLAYEFEKITSTCTYTLERATYTPTQEKVCFYQRDKYEMQKCTGACQYGVTATRYDWADSSYKVCKYNIHSVQLKTNLYNYTYKYYTKGGEIFGMADLHVLGKGSWCTDPTVTWTGTNPESNNMRTSCPAARDCLPGTGTYCKLKQTWGISPNPGRLTLLQSSDYTGFVPPGAGRYDWYGFNSKTTFSNTSDPNNFGSVGVNGQVECPSGLPQDHGPTGYSDPSNPGPASLTKSIWCLATGTPEQHRFRLIADWYDNNGTGASLTAVRSAAATNSGIAWESAAWSKGTATATTSPLHNMGFSGPTPDGGPAASQIFVPIPDDGFDENQQNLRLMNSLKRCAPFNSVTGVDAGGPVTVNGINATWDSRGSGVCIADEAEPTAPGWNTRLDFTPLYGSLASAKDYINRIIDSDNDYLCRSYYVVLATDGVENTPRNYSNADLVTLMGGYRNNRTAGGRTKAIKPFIVAFGNSFTGGTTVLDDMQRAADVGLNRAFSAADPAALKTALTTIFSSITAGTYSRSKPTLSTDGSRLYAGYYARASGTPEWIGELYAYAVDSTSYKMMWGHSLKLNDATTTTDTSRNITAAFGADSSTAVTFRAPSSSSGLNAALTSTPRYSGGSQITADQIINFVRNPDFQQPFPATSPPIYRKSRLGPIIRSGPVVVGVSPYDPSWGGSAAAGTGTSGAQQEFLLFTRRTESRKPIVIFGTGDGMLRAVRDGYGKSTPGSDGGNPYCAPNSSSQDLVGLGVTNGTAFVQNPDGTKDDGHASCPNGTEAWAFVPPEALPKLGELLVPRGAPDGVDGLTSVADVCSRRGGACNSSDWKTIAIGSMRGSGRSLFALDITGGETPPTYLWSFTHSLLGSTSSSPVIGRVNNRGQDTFVGIFGGGRPTAGGSQLISPLGNGIPVAAYQGRALFIIDVLTGAPVMGEQQPVGNSYYPFVSYYNGSSPNRVAFRDAIEPRPGSYRQPNNPYLFAVYVPMKSSEVIALRFSTPDGGTISDPIKWAPSVFWTPYDTQVIFDGGSAVATSGNPPDASTPVADAGSLVPGWTDAGTSDAGTPPATPTSPTGADITQVALDDAGTATSLPTYKLMTPSLIPSQDPEFAQWGADGFPIDGSLRPKAIKPILNRPRAAGITDGTGQTPDIFILTGDENATSATNSNYKFNYIVALHDRGDNPATGLAGEFMWAHYFIDPREQVVSEPAFTPNCMVVATYLPPAIISGASNCAPIGKTTLYAFNARTGALSNCLNYTGMVSGWQGQQTSVIDMGNVGIPSDLITINGKIFFNASNAGLLNVTYLTPTSKFGVRSFRRIR